MVVCREDEGQRLVAAVKGGATFRPFPTRVSDYGFYAALLAYTRERGWQVGAGGGGGVGWGGGWGRGAGWAGVGLG